ncbi:unnamed protein product [Nezara viridula]|uniref:Uncharacterized protein n=1 Tax=Nezara viridula TaxID=85310 RepID=A0A9P0E0C0_NEZVI|nr:unnamed protein product [Nezara viridula]
MVHHHLCHPYEQEAQVIHCHEDHGCRLALRHTDGRASARRSQRLLQNKGTGCDRKLMGYVRSKL